MTRALLALLTCGLCLGLGLETARVQNENYDCAANLDETKRRCDLLEAGSEGLQFRIDTRLAQIQAEDLVRAPQPETTIEE